MERVNDLMRIGKERFLKILKLGIKGMLHKNKLGRQLFTILFVYVGENHPHETQKPVKLDLTGFKKGVK